MTQRPPLPTEILDVAGYEGLYGVTRDGRVWAYPREWRTGLGKNIARYHAGHWLKFDETRGYLRAPLNRSGQTRFVKVHRLVAVAWVANPGGKPEINHIDADRKNNRDSNLEWCTRSENLKHHFRLLRARVDGKAGHQPCARCSPSPRQCWRVDCPRLA